MKNIFSKRFLSDVIALFFYSGKCPVAPGTSGSFFTLFLVMVVYPFGFKGILIASIISYVLGLWATKEVLLRSENKDPSYVVIDETAGQLVTFLTVAHLPFSWINLVLGFALFRLFAITKLPPCSYFDQKVHNAFGVMTDDVFAGLYAGICLFLINYFIF